MVCWLRVRFRLVGRVGRAGWAAVVKAAVAPRIVCECIGGCVCPGTVLEKALVA